jgi:hypothetical protein
VRQLRGWGAAGRFGAVAALLAVGALVGCQPPTPGVTLQSGTRVVRASATVYERGGKQISGTRAVKVLKVHPGALVNIDVDRSLADKGWSFHITSGTSSSDTVNSPVLHVSHLSFNFGSATSDVVISKQGTGSTPGGLWAFTLQPTLQ